MNDADPPRPQSASKQGQMADEHEAWLAAKRALLTVTPSGLRDLEAAVRCPCVCHPQPGRDTHRDQPCRCQWSEAERVRRAREARELLLGSGDHWRAQGEQVELELAEVGAELGVTVREASSVEPWVLTGVTDGVAWYVREDSGQYAVVVSSGTDPTVQPWGAAREVERLSIQTGVTGDLYTGATPDHRSTVRFVVGVVREHLARQSCPHPARPGDRYCPRCGTSLVERSTP